MTTQYTNDFQTPDAVALHMVGMIPAWCKTILEPTKGNGNIVNKIPEDKIVTAPDDYFLMSKDQRFDAIVMNPPFSSKYAFGMPPEMEKHGMRLGYQILLECMDMSDNIIALMPWFTLSDSDV